MNKKDVSEFLSSENFQIWVRYRLGVNGFTGDEIKRIQEFLETNLYPAICVQFPTGKHHQ